MKSGSLTSPLLPRHPLAFGAALAAVIGAIMRVLVVPVLVGSLFDRVLVLGDFDQMLPVLLLGGLITLVGAVALWLQDTLFGRLAGTVSAEWRDATYAALLGRNSLDRSQSSGGIASRIVADLKECEVHLQYGLSSLVAETATVLGILAFLFWTNWQATLVLLVLAIPLLLALGLLGKRVEKVSGEVLQQTEEVGAHLQEGLGQLEVARSYSLGRFLRNRLEPDNRKLAKAMGRRAAWAGVQTPAAQVLGFLALAVLIWLLAGSVDSGSMTLGELTSYVTLLALMGTPLTLLPRAWAMFKQAQAATGRLRQLLPADDAVTPTGSPEPVPGSPTLQLEGVTFTFAGESKPLFDGLSLDIDGPGLVVLLGQSGSGKSTLLRLLLGLLEPDHGRVLLAGRPLAAMADGDLREQVAYVPQNAALFRTSLHDNLDLGRGFTRERIGQVLAHVGLGGLLQSLPDGLDYQLAERGAGLSGGQLQRLAIARALLAEPRVLLLDEPTASLDEASELEIVELLTGLARERLVLVTTHRPALLRNAGLVLELEPGGHMSRRTPTATE